MRVSPGKPVDQAQFRDGERNKANREEVRFAEDLDKSVYEAHLREGVTALTVLLKDDLARFARSSLPEARAGALEAFKDPAAAGVHIDLLRPTSDALRLTAKGEGAPGLVRDAGNLLRLTATAYEKATQLIERKFSAMAVRDSAILGGLEAALDGGDGKMSAGFRVADMFPNLQGEAREMLLRIARFGQMQGAYRNGFVTRLFDLAGVPNGWWALEAFNQDTNRRRTLRAKPKRSARIDTFGGDIPAVPEGTPTVSWFLTVTDRLVESSGRLRWVVQPTSVLFWISRVFGLSEGGDISGTTTDALFILEGLIAQPEGEPVRRAFGADLGMAYLLPLVHMLKEQHHSLLEIGYALSLNQVCEYVINDYASLLPKGVSPRSTVGKAFLEVARNHKQDARLFLDGTNADEIRAKLLELYPLSMASEPIEDRTAAEAAAKKEGEAVGDVNSAIGTKSEIWTLESVDELAAYRQLATCGPAQYRMFATLRDRKAASLAEVVAAALGTNRGPAINRLCQVRAGLPA